MRAGSVRRPEQLRVKKLGKALLLIVAIATLMALVIRFGVESGEETFERDLALLLAGGLLGVMGNIAVNWLSRTEEYRKGAYTERAKAVQELLDSARVVKQTYLDDWHARDAEMGVEREAPCFQEGKDDLLRLGFRHDVWVAERGVQAIRDFNSALDPALFGDFSNHGEVEAFLQPHFGALRKALCRDLGFAPE